MSRTGIKRWHRAQCGWCNNRAKGDAIFTSPVSANTNPVPSCGRPDHGDEFERFPPDEQADQ